MPGGRQTEGGQTEEVPRFDLEFFDSDSLFLGHIENHSRHPFQFGGGGRARCSRFWARRPFRVPPPAPSKSSRGSKRGSSAACRAPRGPT
ncbi:hypothetical protein L596_008789 [Steinernema carpocapsae]|uniref:Uncharacterized protein n=1 Tax=Steinernema carpocapsae TaxID=34508 RepID=A0A4U5PEN2_STECR|nr:hypothetical protein L596_008789 [Steinernema carpocapsae]